MVAASTDQSTVVIVVVRRSQLRVSTPRHRLSFLTAATVTTSRPDGQNSPSVACPSYGGGGGGRVVVRGRRRRGLLEDDL